MEGQSLLECELRDLREAEAYREEEAVKWEIQGKLRRDKELRGLHKKLLKEHMKRIYLEVATRVRV